MQTLFTQLNKNENSINWKERYSKILNQQGQAEHLSDRYKHFTTADAISVFESQGFEISSVKVANTNKASNQGFQKHYVQLNSDALTETWQKLRGNEEVPNLTLVNSYNGTSSLQVIFGLYRLVCSNGLAVGNAAFRASFKHIGQNFETQIASFFDSMPEKIEQVARKVSRLSEYRLDDLEAMEFALKAARLRQPRACDGTMLLSTRRVEDQELNAWNVYNRVQENLIERPDRRLFIKTLERNAETGKDELKVKRLRKIVSPNTAADLNQKLFDLILDAVNAA